MSKVLSIEYTLTDANSGEHLDTNVGKAPLEFITEKNQIIPGLESKLLNMAAGEQGDVLVDPKDGYGEYNPEAVQNLPKEQFAGIDLAEGMTLYGQGENNQTVQVTVKSFDEKEVVIDYNHPMAGRSLMFSVAVLSERAATEEEIQTGIVGGMAAMSGGCCGGGHCDDDHGHSHESEGGCCSSEPKEQSQGGGCGCGH
ncbi:MAG: peptidylprolyl isomerase [Sphaerochaetaceae bacterium]|nr:peptidylprolyl isomerase [Sphaerochaetaceae bacterium]